MHYGLDLKYLSMAVCQGCGAIKGPCKLQEAEPMEDWDILFQAPPFPATGS
jgi:hypothetical protein